MKLAAIADLHYRISSAGLLHELLAGAEREVEALMIGGDLTDTGLEAEMEVLIEDLRRIELPIVTVLGNHDHEGGQHELLTEMLTRSGVMVLEDNAVEISGVNFVGTKGFCGGFGEHLIQPFGEQAIKRFTEESAAEANRLENALARTSEGPRLVILHYSPVIDTLTGESVELYPFLGTSRLAEAIDRQGADMIIHGHAHNGSAAGATADCVPVYNVCRFVPQEGRRAWRLLEL
ncbi:MAG: metallophosphoesterase [Thermoleophilia bacterium]|nr:metallophosphoesterase [Thermoleophilia bacterium]